MSQPHARKLRKAKTSSTWHYFGLEIGALFVGLQCTFDEEEVAEEEVGSFDQVAEAEHLAVPIGELEMRNRGSARQRCANYETT